MEDEVISPSGSRSYSLRSGITLGQLLGGCLVVIGSMLAFWKSTDVRLSSLEINNARQDKDAEDSKQEFRAEFRTLGEKMDNLNQGQNDIKVTLQNKQDRPK